ncbi:GerW family sporulation protein [Kineothrix sp. MSJ-39]|uniref:GerW family sporulation protein n=1 Tax=Kineothrix sp. MSJ-39 TaxID=2841533 RepID=UPI001C11997F|nr:GerW family sporulation protein [Kineothrix sp. MSJ-39]MBU5428593.1 GerW family sporulation protein [Kineothrix sp. MSJ-39]
MNNNFSEVVSSLLSGVDNFLSTKTVVGQATQIGDTIILPLVDVTFGVGAGAAAGEQKNSGFGGITGKMSPSAVLVIKNGQTKLVNVRNQDAVTKIIDMIPDLVDKFTAPKEDTDDMVSDEKAQEIAFGQDSL